MFSSQVVPLLLVTDYAHGGYNMTDTDIGVFVMAVAIFQIFFQVPVISRYCYQVCNVILLLYSHCVSRGLSSCLVIVTRTRPAWWCLL